MKRLAGLAAAAIAALTATSAQAAWTKGFVLSHVEPAMYFGGKDKAILEPGTDCPNGANKEIDWEKVLVDAGYTPAQAKWLRDPANPTRDPIHGQNQMAFRGRNRENVYIHPTTTPEVGLPSVEGKIGEGFDLDGDRTTGFVSPSGQKGVDNNYYKAFGCWKNYRAPAGLGAAGYNDTMKTGSFTVLMVLTGQGQDPMNDPNVTVSIYAGQDKVVTSGAGKVTRDYTFRVQPHPLQEASMKARIVKGKLITEVTPEIIMQGPAGGYGGMHMLKARGEFQLTADGELEGMMGGYIPWEPIYDGMVRARGPIVEILGWVRLPDVYYALRRYADYSPEGPKGRKTHISYAMRIHAVPAYVMTPDASQPVTASLSFKAQAKPLPPQQPGRFSKGPIIDGLVIAAGEKPESLPEERLLPPKATQVSAAGGS
jgi:hypothetical protein